RAFPPCALCAPCFSLYSVWLFLRVLRVLRVSGCCPPPFRSRRAYNPGPVPIRTVSMSEPLRLVFAGTPEFSVPSLEACLGSGAEVVAVYTQPDRPAGRGRKLA